MKNKNILNNTSDTRSLFSRLKLGFLIMLPLMVLSCKQGLLDQLPTTDLSADQFWQNSDDAVYAVNGVYNAIRQVYGREYYWDGAGEFVHVRNTSWSKGGSYNPAPLGNGFNNLWQDCYTTVNRSNYVLVNLQEMRQNEEVSADPVLFDRLEGEIRFLRALAYFRLIDLWGDVPYFNRPLEGNDEAFSLPRTPKSDIKDSILVDLAYAAETLPETYPNSERGRATQNAALGFSGKVNLFWACWAKNEGDLADAQTHYAAAAEDFKQVIDKGVSLFRGGDPGPEDNPNYGQLFTHHNEYDPEIIFSIQFGGPQFSQGEEMMRDHGTRNTGSGQTFVSPTYRLINRYQLRSTGDYAPELVLSRDNSLENGSVNPETYHDRDLRMRGTVLWDGEKIMEITADGMTTLDSIAFRFGTRDGVDFINYGEMRSGYLARKWLRQEAGWGRSDGPQDMYLMRVPDIWLMYCEAVNEVNGGPTGELFDLVDQIRARGALPPLNRMAYSTQETFFEAVEQERIVEFIGEGHRFFDIRRWRKLEEIWPLPGGQILYNVHGERVRDEFLNAPPRDYDRYYIFMIPQSELDLNPALTQNEPWL